MHRRLRWVRWHAAALLACLGLLACAHAKIAGTQVPDTPENRQIYDVLRQVKIAFEAGDHEALLALVSPRYFEDNGTPDQKDDYGFLELREKLVQEALQTAKDVTLVIQLYDIEVQGDHAWADLRYTTRARLELPSGRLWEQQRDFDRMEFAREDGRWLIVRGL